MKIKKLLLFAKCNRLSLNQRKDEFKTNIVSHSLKQQLNKRAIVCRHHEIKHILHDARSMHFTSLYYIALTGGPFVYLLYNFNFKIHSNSDIQAE